MVYCYHYQVEFQKRGNKFCKEIKNYQVESFEPDFENALINEVILQFLRNFNNKSYVGEYSIEKISFIGCEKQEVERC